MKRERRVLSCLLGGSLLGLGLFLSCTPALPQAPAASTASPPSSEAAPAAIDTAAVEPAPPPEPEEHPPGDAVATVTPSPDDPVHGKFSLADATAGIAGSGALVATIDTELGQLECELYADEAPLTVANFVGLARGNRPWKNPSGNWVNEPAYDGTGFHRIIKGFMIQGGDPKGNGTGTPGYVIQDEYWPNALYDRAGLLCLANRGSNTGGMQFFITDGPAPHLDGRRHGVIFGQCGPLDVVHALASVEVTGDRAVNAPRIKSIRISRRSNGH